MIYVGAGHGGQTKSGLDQGAIANGTTEFSECTKILSALTELHPNDIRIVPQRLTLKYRIDWINRNLRPDDTYVEMHMNAASPQATGVEVFYLRRNQLQKGIADGMANRYSKKTGLTNRGAKPDTAAAVGSLGIITETKCNAYLIELGFITNKDDVERVRQKGVHGMEQVLSIPSTDPADWTLPTWAIPSWEKAKRKGIISEKTNPYEEIHSATLQWIFHNGGVFDTPPKKEKAFLYRIVVGLDRTKWFDSLPDKK